MLREAGLDPTSSSQGLAACSADSLCALAPICQQLPSAFVIEAELAMPTTVLVRRCCGSATHLPECGDAYEWQRWVVVGLVSQSFVTPTRADLQTLAAQGCAVVLHRPGRAQCRYTDLLQFVGSVAGALAARNSNVWRGVFVCGGSRCWCRPGWQWLGLVLFAKRQRSH